MQLRSIDGRFQFQRRSPFQRRRVALDRAIKRWAVDIDDALLDRIFQVTVANPVSAISADSLQGPLLPRMAQSKIANISSIHIRP
jgi:hypothetical protein